MFKDLVFLCRNENLGWPENDVFNTKEKGPQHYSGIVGLLVSKLKLIITERKTFTTQLKQSWQTNEAFFKF